MPQWPWPSEIQHTCVCLLADMGRTAPAQQDPGHINLHLDAAQEDCQDTNQILETRQKTAVRTRLGWCMLLNLDMPLCR